MDPIVTSRRNEYLQSIVETAKVIFCAAASSVFLLSPDRQHLVFAAVAGEGEGHLVGTSFPSDTGIAGWVAVTGESVAVDDVDDDSSFSRQAAEATGYLPRAILAAPVVYEDDVLGVLEVLDPQPDRRGSLSDLEVLGRFASQAAVALDVLEHGARETRASSAAAVGDLVIRAASQMTAQQQALVNELIILLSDSARLD